MQADNHGNLQYESGWVPADLTLSDYRAAGGVVYDTCGIGALGNWLNNYTGPTIHYVEIAPVSSLAALLDIQPGWASKLTVFAMNGQIDVGYGNETGPQVEWNVLVSIKQLQQPVRSEHDSSGSRIGEEVSEVTRM